MRRSPALLASFILAACIASSPQTAEAQLSPPQEILMIGNSLTRGIGHHLKRLFREDDARVKIKSLAPRGYRLSDHVNRGRAAKKIASRAWDVVILQEQSDGIYESRYPAARVLDELITDAGATTMFFMTWRQRGDAPSAYDDLKGVPGGSIGYVPIAFELDAPLAPVGWAFRSAVVADPNADLWGDAVHANKTGRYLAACVFYAAIMRTSPVGNAFQPHSLDQSEALALQQLAADTVLTDPAQWNIPTP